MSDPRFELPMTREVLSDCKVALRELCKDPPYQHWRIQWVGMVALLRTVADAFKEDAKQPTVNLDLKAELNGFLNRVKNQDMWKFIDEGRNGLLHEWKFATTHVAIEQRDDMTVIERRVSALRQTIVHLGGFGNQRPKPGRTYHMKSGPFTGQDPRDVVQQAISWYEDEIASMKSRAEAKLQK